MRAYWPFIVVGLTAGSVYALAAMGLVLTYTTSGVFNFAHGATGMFATFVFYEWRDAVPTWLAFVAVVLVLAPLFGAFVGSVLFRPLAGAPTSVNVVASLGLLVALQSTALAVFDVRLRQAEPILPQGRFRLGGVYVGVDQAFVVGIAALAAVGLALFFRRTHLGLQTRAVIADGELSELVGANSRRITTFAWMLGSAFAALSGILLAPTIGLDAVILTLLVVQAFGAASVGRLTSLPLTYAGAIGIGVAAAVSTKFVTEYRGLAGIPSSLPFLVLFGVLVLSPKGTFREVVEAGAAGRNVRRGDRSARPVSPRVAVAGLVAAVAIPWFLTGSQLVTATATVAFVLVFASLGLLVGLSRQVSLCHATFVVIGTTTLAHLLGVGVPYPIALPLAGLIVAPVGALIAIPALRLSGLFLALATFGFGVAAQYLLFSTGLLFGQDQRAIIGRPDAFGLSLQGDLAFYFFALAVVVAGVIAVEVVRRTRLGRLLRALADSPDAVRSLGVDPTASRVLVFALSAFLAAEAGGLLGALYQRFNTFTLDFFQSLVWLTVLVTAGAASLSGSVLAAVLFVAVPSAFVSVSWFGEYQPIFFGLAAVFLARTPNGLVGLFSRPDFAVWAARAAPRREASWHTDRARRRDRRLTQLDFRLDERQQAFLEGLRAYLDGIANTDEVVADFERDFTLITGPSREFLRRLGRDGWLGIGWPVEYGGQGRSALEQWLFLEEMAYRRLPSGNLTLSSIGPVIARFGTEAQKQEYLPGILAADLEFAIGYTEPDAGTDLANLQTRATRRPDGGYAVRGQKVFTTGASIATHLWLAARTGAPDSRHRGISLFIVPMDSPGITVRPLITQSGERTNEVFLDDVPIGAAGLVGEENGGWAAITHQLDLERLFAVGLLRWQFEQLVTGQGSGEDPYARHRLAVLGADLEASRLLNLRAAWMIDSGETPYAEASMAKVWYSELRQRLALEALDLMGPEGQLAYGEDGAPDGGHFERSYRSSTVFKFGAGANEVQRTIIAQRALNLPRTGA